MTETDRGSSEPQHRHVETGDPEYAAEILRETYRVSGGVRVSDVGEDFHFSQDVVAAQAFSLTRFRTTATVGYRGPLDGLLVVDHVHAGRLSFETTEGRVDSGAGDLCLVPSQEPWQATTVGIDVAPLVLDRDRVARHAAALSGIAPGSLTFHGLEPVSSAAARHWIAAVDHVRDDVFGNAEVAASPLVRDEAFRVLATGLLTLFPNTAVDALDDRPASRSRDAEPASIRRAAAYMDAHAQSPIGLTEVAAAARLGARGLQYNFRRFRGCTPLEYLRRVRLAGAHHDLVTGDPTRGDSVAVIAARWGFSNPGRFSAEYRRHYGCAPSATLRD